MRAVDRIGRPESARRRTDSQEHERAMRFDVWARRHCAATFAIAVALQVAIALPFVWVDTDDVRGVPGPTLVLVTVVAAYLVGARLGALLGVIAAVRGVAVFDINWLVAPPLWVAFAALAGLVGSSSTADATERSQLSHELQ